MQWWEMAETSKDDANYRCRERKCDNRGDETPLKSASSVIVRHHGEENRTAIGSQPLMDFAKGRV